MKLYDSIFSIKNEIDFERTALQIFDYQVENCSVYREYVQQLNWSKPTCLTEIPFLPISFFKSHKIITNGSDAELVFKSSGTGGERSTHFVADKSLYINSFNLTYDEWIGDPKDQVIIALLPNYLEQGESSLVFMVDHLIKRSQNSLSGFYLNDFNALIETYKKAIELGKQVVLFGVSYALMDLTELNPDLSKALIIETGGMKGRRAEITKNELHELLSRGLNCKHISSEYGMTELLSQAYLDKNGVFKSGKHMRVLIRDVNDPFHFIENEKTGGINVIDLANIQSCSFIATQDLGRIVGDGFEVMGRFDNADLRGCNLLVH